MIIIWGKINEKLYYKRRKSDFILLLVVGFWLMAFSTTFFYSSAFWVLAQPERLAHNNFFLFFMGVLGRFSPQNDFLNWRDCFTFVRNDSED
jgi:hypothetical protein